MKIFVGLRAKIYSYLIDNGTEDKKAKSSKKCIIKRKLKFENYENCLEATQLEKKTIWKKINLKKSKKSNDFFCYKRKLNNS